MTFDTQTLTRLVGFGIDYTGDMANPSGKGAIVATYSDKWGQHVDIALEDGREIKRFCAAMMGTPDMRRGCAVRVILTGPAHGAPYMAQLGAAVATRKANDKAREQVNRANFEAGEAARKIDAAPLFYWNGIKDDKGAKLQKAWYILGNLTRYPEGTITICGRDYSSFSDKVSACFKVDNETDTMTDYFDNDHIRVIPAHPLYGVIRAAYEAQEAHQQKASAKRSARA